MNVRELKEILKNYPDEAIIQINVSDFAETLGLSEISIDTQYDIEDALVFEVSIEEYDEELFFAKEN